MQVDLNLQERQVLLDFVVTRLGEACQRRDTLKARYNGARLDEMESWHMSLHDIGFWEWLLHKLEGMK